MDDKYAVRPDVINYDDIRKMIPMLDGHPKLVGALLHALWMDKVNSVHGNFCHLTGIPFSHALIEEQFRIRLRVDNEAELARFPDGAFVTVSNHPFGALDGILMLHLAGKYRSDYRVMVNMFLNHLSAMRPSFIAVDPSQSDNPEKKKVTLDGIREALAHVRSGHPIGFFPAGAVSKINRHLRLRDRQWQPSVIRLIRQLGVPVIPVFFHGRNSTFFNILGVIDWRLRTLRLPRELFNKTGKEVHVSVGQAIMPETIASFGTVEALGDYLRKSTYSLASLK